MFRARFDLVDSHTTKLMFGWSRPIAHAFTDNMLVPHSHCMNTSGPHDLYAEYAATRTVAAIAHASLLPINASDSGQPCARFGLHPSMPFLQGSYEAGEAAFVANVGALVRHETTTLEPDLVHSGAASD